MSGTNNDRSARSRGEKKKQCLLETPARFAARLVSEGGSFPFASPQPRLCVAVRPGCDSTSGVPVSFPEWTSTDRGASWPAHPAEVSPPSCAPAEYVGFSNYAAPTRG